MYKKVRSQLVALYDKRGALGTYSNPRPYGMKLFLISHLYMKDIDSCDIIHVYLIDFWCFISVVVKRKKMARIVHPHPVTMATIGRARRPPPTPTKKSTHGAHSKIKTISSNSISGELIGPYAVYIYNGCCATDFL